MNCHEARVLLPAYGDGELDPLRTADFERHLSACAECTAGLDAFHALRRKIRAHAPYHAAPAALRERIERIGKAHAEPARPRRTFFAGLALGCAATVLAWFVTTAAIDRIDGSAFERAVVATHVHATLGDRLVTVASSDRHTVKPWLTARLDYAPPVKDMASEGFPLLGGRIDTLDNRAVAALVYGYRDHRIGVFVRPHDGADLPAEMGVVRGFNVAHLRRGGMEWWAVSDLNAEQLRGLVTSLAAPE